MRPLIYFSPSSHQATKGFYRPGGIQPLNRLSLRLCALAVNVLFLFFSCGLLSPDNKAPEGVFTISPTFSGADSTFYVDASGCTDDEDNTSKLQVRWDWENDGAWDTDWSTVKTDSHVFNEDGVHIVKLGVKDKDGEVTTATRVCSASVWRQRAPMPTVRGNLAAGVIDGKIYILGGQYYDGMFTRDVKTVEEYNPIMDTWETKQPMLTSRANLAAGVVNDKLYAVGGG